MSSYDPEVEAALEAAKAALKEGAFPFSIVHLLETSHIGILSSLSMVWATIRYRGLTVQELSRMPNGSVIVPVEIRPKKRK